MIKITPSKLWPHLWEVKIPFALKDEAKAVGCSWDPDSRSWMVGKAYLDDVLKWAEEVDTVSFEEGGKVVGFPGEDSFPKTLFSYQVEVLRKVANSCSNLLALPMGTGKTVIGTSAAMAIDGSGVVVCPASTRLNWARHFKEWWPDSPPVYAVSPGHKLKKFHEIDIGEPHVTIISYKMLQYVAGRDYYDWIIFDEIHNLGNRASKQTKLAHQLSINNPQARKIGLTGTAIPNVPLQLWGQLQALEPFGWGHYWNFTAKYFSVTEEIHRNRVVPKPGDPHPDGLSRLRKDLEHILLQVPKSVTDAVLPPLTVETLPIERPTGIGTGRLDLDKFCGESVKPKLGVLVDELKAALPEVRHACVLVYHHKAVRQCSKVFDGAGLEYGVITGETPDSQREGIATQVVEGGGILLCTIAAVAEGVNFLKDFEHVWAVQLYWKIGMLKQVLGRFSRAQSSPAHVKLLTLEGSVDEVIADRLSTRSKTISSILGSDTPGRALEGALDLNMTQEQFLADWDRLGLESDEEE